MEDEGDEARWLRFRVAVLDWASTLGTYVRCRTACLDAGGAPRAALSMVGQEAGGT